MKAETSFVRCSLVLTASTMAWLCGVPAVAQSHPSHDDTPKTDQQSLPITIGTILPVRLNHVLFSRSARSGQLITGRIMQDVPLPGGGKIPEGAKLIGSVVAVTPAGNTTGASISLRFNQLEIHHRRFPIVTNLRAVASLLEVESAQTPETSLGFGTPYVWATTRQIGGDEKYGVGGPVTDQWSQTVGVGEFDGVLVHVHAQPGSLCRGALDAEDRLQALWLFSADACGVYGIPGLKILHAGRTNPLGEITLATEGGDLKLRSGSGLLLRVLQ